MTSKPQYNAFNVYRRELAPGTVSLTGDRAQGDDSKHWAYFSVVRLYYMYFSQKISSNIYFINCSPIIRSNWTS